MAFDVAAKHGPDRGFAFHPGGGHGRKVLLANKVLGPQAHALYVEWVPEMVRVALGEVLDGTTGGVMDAVAIELAYSAVPRVERRMNLPKFQERHVFRQPRPDRMLHFPNIKLVRCTKMTDMPGRVNA